eukprot:scaffold3761_cov372-Prasinococcus_capsulatus_cf.AAC.9
MAGSIEATPVVGLSSTCCNVQATAKHVSQTLHSAGAQPPQSKRAPEEVLIGCQCHSDVRTALGSAMLCVGIDAIWSRRPELEPFMVEVLRASFVAAFFTCMRRSHSVAPSSATVGVCSQHSTAARHGSATAAAAATSSADRGPSQPAAWAGNPSSLTTAKEAPMGPARHTWVIVEASCCRLLLRWSLTPAAPCASCVLLLHRLYLCAPPNCPSDDDTDMLPGRRSPYLWVSGRRGEQPADVRSRAACKQPRTPCSQGKPDSPGQTSDAARPGPVDIRRETAQGTQGKGSGHPDASASVTLLASPATGLQHATAPYSLRRSGYCGGQAHVLEPQSLAEQQQQHVDFRAGRSVGCGASCRPPLAACVCQRGDPRSRALDSRRCAVPRRPLLPRSRPTLRFARRAAASDAPGAGRVLRRSPQRVQLPRRRQGRNDN